MPAFADTSLFVAFLNPRDRKHAEARKHLGSYRSRIITTRWVLAELGNYLSGGENRGLFVPFVNQLRADPRIRILSTDDEMFDRGLELYGSRPDKGWSMVDCISFEVMNDLGLREAFSSDHHFEQAGFKILL